MRKTIVTMLAALAWAVGIRAGEAVTVLNVETLDGKTYHFLLADQQPVIKSQKSQMQVTYLAKAGETERTVLIFSHEEVKRLTFSGDIPAAVPAVKRADGVPVLFDLSEPNRVTVHGLPDGQRVTVYTLDGRSAVSPVRSSGGSVTIDLSGQRRGTYLINAGGQRTFKLRVEK